MAAIASATLHDVGLVTKEDFLLVIDRSKIRRERLRVKKKTIKKEIATKAGIKGIYFEGSKDKTLIQGKTGNRYYQRTISEEHISLIAEPYSLYLVHITSSSGSGKNIAKSIYTF